MDFVVRIRDKAQITIPNEIMEYDGFKVGDLVVVSVRKKDSIEQWKKNLEKGWHDRTP
jgi:bifunctional DNA-binding transcriptional regulator/antitoxin component of YhaV-PrlF toxin-antitoxin module